MVSSECTSRVDTVVLKIKLLLHQLIQQQLLVSSLKSPLESVISKAKQLIGRGCARMRTMWERDALAHVPEFFSLRHRPSRQGTRRLPELVVAFLQLTFTPLLVITVFCKTKQVHHVSDMTMTTQRTHRKQNTPVLLKFAKNLLSVHAGGI